LSGRWRRRGDFAGAWGLSKNRKAADSMIGVRPG
jgi:hypothetical protein